MLLLIFGLIMFIGLVVVHEFGHFVMARRNGIEVEEFGIGFPPRAWKKRIKSQKGDFDFSINWLPLGGFVKLKGENDADTEKGSFGAARLGAKVKVMVAGVFMNLVTAFLLLTIIALLGVPQLVDGQFTVASDSEVKRSDLLILDSPESTWVDESGFEQGDIIKSAGGQDISEPEDLKQAVISAQGEPFEIEFERGGELQSKEVQVPAGVDIFNVGKESPAESAGLAKGDTIISIDGIELYDNNQLGQITEANAGETVEVVYSKQGSDQVQSTEVQLRDNEFVQQKQNEGEAVGYFGVSTNILPAINHKEIRSTWSAPIVAGGLIKQFTALTFQGLGTAIGNLVRGEGAKASEQVAGPVGIFVILQQGSFLGVEYLLLIIAIISLTLAIMNILPIPALDGGRLFVTLLFKAINKPLTKDLEDKIHGTGFLLLMLLFVVITVVDIRRFF